MSISATFNVYGGSGIDDLNFVGSFYATISENATLFQPIWNSMNTYGIFYSDTTTQWGDYVNDYFKTTELSPAITVNGGLSTSFITPITPVIHQTDDINHSYSRTYIAFRYPIQVGDVFLRFDVGLSDSSPLGSYAFNTFSIRRRTTTGDTYIGLVNLPIGYSYRNTETFYPILISKTTDGYYQALQYNSATPNKNNARYNYIYGAVANAFSEFLENSPYTPPPSDPYSNAGDSDTGGGGGTWDDGSDPVNIPSLPSVGATNTGFISLFVPSQAQLKSVAEYMWGGLFDLSTWKRLFEDPMDCILGLSVVPVSVPTSGSASITVGNIELSGISLPVASQQYVAVDCGSLTITPYFGSYLDYEPYTKMALFVPYSGVHTVNADDLMERTVNLVYHIDILTGSLVAFLKCGDSVLYEFNGACSSNIPVNSMNYASTIENAVRIATNIGTTVATAGASAPLSAGAEGVSQGVAGAQNIARGVSLAGSTADGALSLKPNIDRAGSLGGTTGLLGNQTPYFIITRPRLCKPKDQNKIKGYPAFINYSVSDLVGKGYTEFDTILLQNLYLTDDEKNELESILKGGVYL